MVRQGSSNLDKLVLTQHLARYNSQNQYFRHIRNFVFDMTEMPLNTNENDQPFVPTGIHWQVAQATTLQNLKFIMPISSTGQRSTHYGIFTENGSGGFVSGSSNSILNNALY